MAGIIQAFRDILLDGRLPGAYLIPAALVSAALLVLGYWLFKRLEFRFADVI
jgi:ABC-type polysaccharide/polyol phosphate export permease